jgi:hypothetical protein
LNGNNRKYLHRSFRQISKRLINLATTGVVDEENSDKYIIGAFNYIKGICDMANAMKEVLKVN